MKIRLITALLVVLTMSILSVGCFGADLTEYHEIEPVVSDANNQPQTSAVETHYLPEDIDALQLIEYYLQVLTSEDFAGRMPGTAGNDATIDWLIGHLEAFGVEPYNADDHRIGYIGRTNTFANSEMIVINDGVRRALIQGVDFFIPLREGNFNAHISSGGNNYTFLDSRSERMAAADCDADNFVYFDIGESFVNTTYAPWTDDPFRGNTVQLSPDIGYELQNGIFDEIEIFNEIAYADMELYHVVGRIRGKGSTAVVVLTAHFDHMGKGGATFFPGALDNASGTAALLLIAERLATLSKTQPFDFDIVIAFTNSEEFAGANGLPLGSQSLIETLADDYETIFNINIDCVGFSENETFLSGDVGCSVLRDAFEAFAADRGITLDTAFEANVMSDNANFRDAGFASISFTSLDGLDAGIIHTNHDTYDRLCIPQIIRVSEMIADFIVEKGSGVFVNEHIGDIDQTPMSVRFGEAFDRLLDGEFVKFYDEFYRYFPSEPQFYFSVYEALEADERIGYIDIFGDYILRLHRGSLNSERLGFIYFNVQDLSMFVLTVMPLNVERDLHSHMLGSYTFTEISNLPGYSIFRHHTTGDSILGFMYTDGENYFIVRVWRSFDAISTIADDSVRRLEPEGSATFTMATRLGGGYTEDDFIEFVGNLQFAEFIYGWTRFNQE